jgi:hypothetical protein
MKKKRRGNRHSDESANPIACRAAFSVQPGRFVIPAQAEICLPLSYGIYAENRKV